MLRGMNHNLIFQTLLHRPDRRRLLRIEYLNSQSCFHLGPGKLPAETGIGGIIHGEHKEAHGCSQFLERKILPPIYTGDVGWSGASDVPGFVTDASFKGIL